MTRFMAVVVLAYMGVQAMRMLKDVFTKDLPLNTQFILLFVTAVILSLGCVIVALLFKEQNNGKDRKDQ